MNYDGPLGIEQKSALAIWPAKPIALSRLACVK